MHSTVAPSHSRWDRLGIAFSGLCLLHCAVLPTLAFLPLLEGVGWIPEVVHAVAAPAAIGVGVLALANSRGRSSARWTRRLIGAGLVLVALGVVGHALGSEVAETAASGIGGALLVAGHGLKLGGAA
jgi:FtsH-binding integral membrane protein